MIKTYPFTETISLSSGKYQLIIHSYNGNHKKADILSVLYKSEPYC